MSMTNFLPWRRQRRVRCLRFWGVLFVATWLLILMGVFSLRMNPLVMTRALHIQLAGMQSVQQALVSRTGSGTQTPTPAPAPQRRASASTTRLAAGAGVLCRDDAIPGLADRTALSAPFTDVNRICRNTPRALCSAGWARKDGGVYPRAYGGITAG